MPGAAVLSELRDHNCPANDVDEQSVPAGHSLRVHVTFLPSPRRPDPDRRAPLTNYLAPYAFTDRVSADETAAGPDAWALVRAGHDARVARTVRSEGLTRAFSSVDKRRRSAPRHTGGEPAMTNDTDASTRPTLWGDVPESPAASTRSRGPAQTHRPAAEASELWKSSGTSGKLRPTSAFRSRPSTPGARVATDFRLPRRQAPALASTDGDRMDRGARAPEVTAEDQQPRSCPRCGARIVDACPRPPGRPKRWCSARCRRAASEERRAAAAGAIATEYVQMDVSLDDHVAAVLASPAACRRVLRDLGERYDTGKLDDARWSSVAEELHRTRPQNRPTVRWGAR